MSATFTVLLKLISELHLVLGGYKEASLDLDLDENQVDLSSFVVTA